MLLKAAPKDVILSLAVDVTTDFQFVDIVVSTFPFAFSVDEIATFMSSHLNDHLHGTSLSLSLSVESL